MCALFHPEVPQAVEPTEPAQNKFPKIAGAEIAASIFQNRVGGDFYDSFSVGQERILFGLLDVAGRAETNRTILDAAQKLFRTVGSQLFAPFDMNESDAMVQLCIQLNIGIMEKAAGVHPCPAFIGCYHERLGTLCYTNAGHTAGLLRDSTGVTELSSTGLPLGLFSHATCEAPTVGIEKGAALLLVSRGVVDGISKDSKDRDTEGEDGEFGLERTKNFLRSDHSPSAQSLCASVLHQVGQFIGEPLVPDDMTALALIRTA
ncbi:MAG TPA: SpoIIE family protein phosphatase [Candidatus Aquilonibacter sp.]|nr:SpoIIE family protein phosphatase [Candidatus Aquilonibacter sp.]